MRCTVVIPVRNGASLIGVQLEALATQDCTDFEVIVADNGSTDGTPDVAAAWGGRFACFRVIDAAGAPGVSIGRNAGASAASTDRILFADADDRADPGWVRALSDALHSADLVGGALVTSEINEDGVRRWTEEPSRTELPTALRYLPYAVGSNLGVRKAVWADLGGFDNSFVGGHEEVDFCWRAQRAGYTIAFVPEAVMHYRLRDTIRGALRQRSAYGRSNAQLHSRYRDVPGLPPFTRRRALRVLLSHLRQPRPLFDQRTRSGWLIGFSWALGRLEGVLRYQRDPRRI